MTPTRQKTTALSPWSLPRTIAFWAGASAIASIALLSAAQADPMAPGLTGGYARLELGLAQVTPQSGNWMGPSMSAPLVSFSGNSDTAGFAELAFGYDWQNGWRSDLSIFGTGTADATGTCASASDNSSCSGHADITAATIKTKGLMANVFYVPMASSSQSTVQPYVTAGLGVARNDLGEWTRRNPSSSQVERSFEGGSSTGLAWSIGVGASVQLSKAGDWPVMLDASWRYFDFGHVSGSTAPLPGSGGSTPPKAYNFDNTAQVISLGLRIPLQNP